ncbi:hypothetical protein [Streptomyces sp. NPDC058579]|uniref:hypothetical protein n=1 Tax=Streptomyces sp. NPDC058579 TaxID=3346548 RepID=UPI003649A9D6
MAPPAAVHPATTPAAGQDNKAAAPATYVEPIDWTRLGSYSATDPAGGRMKQILRNSSRYLIGPWYANTYKTYAPDGYLHLGGADERSVRLPAMTALSTATALKLGVYDPVTLPEDKATIRGSNLIRTIAARHRANDSDTATAWGGGWQTALWAYYAGTAAWLMWDQLPTADREKAVRMLAFEADRLCTGDDLHLVGTSGIQLFMTRRDGSVVTPGDTKAEENSWSAAVLGLSAAMMPTHPSAPRWIERNHELLLAATAGPADLASTTPVNGINPSEWLRGTNIDDDGTLENHGFLHPLYMVALDQSIYQGAIWALAGTCAPRAGLHNISRIYSALVDKDFGGRTIYTPGSADIHYPEGNDWGTRFPLYFGTFDLLVSLTGQDAGISPNAATWEALHNQEQLDMQARFTDGRTYANPGENSYHGAEQRIGVLAAQSYLTLFLYRGSAEQKVCWHDTVPA